MGRPSKLTESQWDELGQRLSGGEIPADLSREYGISQTSISKRFSQFPKNEIRKVAETLAAMPVQASAAAMTLADTLRTMQGSANRGGQYGLATAEVLHERAYREVRKIGDEPVDLETLKGVAALTRTANEAASMGMVLLAANRDSGKGDAAQPIAIDHALSMT
jgi:hypothetical protein